MRPSRTKTVQKILRSMVRLVSVRSAANTSKSETEVDYGRVNPWGTYRSKGLQDPYHQRHEGARGKSLKPGRGMFPVRDQRFSVSVACHRNRCMFRVGIILAASLSIPDPTFSKC
jgi:hypothetical protein